MLELTVVPTSLDFIKKCDFCDSFIVGQKDFGLRLPTYFTKTEIVEIIKLAKERNQKVYIALNKIIHEPNLDDTKTYLKWLKEVPVDGIIFGDLAIYSLAKELNLIHKLIYNPETYITNYETVSFFARKGIKRVSIAKEITLEDIQLIASKELLEVEILGHGAINMFHSMRDLVSNYFRFLKDEEPEKYRHQNLYLIEEKREDQFPIVEDENGTHVFSGEEMCTIDYIDELVTSHVTSIRIDGLFKNDDVLYQICKVYHEAIQDYTKDCRLYKENKLNYHEKLNHIKGIRPFNEGFLFKKTVYKGEDNEKD